MMLLDLADIFIAAASLSLSFVVIRFLRGVDGLEGATKTLAMLLSALLCLRGLVHIARVAGQRLPLGDFETWIDLTTCGIMVTVACLVTAPIPRLRNLPWRQMLQGQIDAQRRAVAAAREALAQDFSPFEETKRGSVGFEPESSTLLATIIEAAPGLIYAKDRNGRMLMSNKATLELIGKPWSDVEGKTDSEFLADQHPAHLLMGHDDSVMASGEFQEYEEIVDYPGKGPRIWLSTKTPFIYARGSAVGMVGVSVDITERKNLEKEVVNISRRVAMSEMGTAIAHEINQPLSAASLYISGCIAIIENEQDMTAVIPTLNLAHDQCQRAGQIIRRLRSFVSDTGALKLAVEMRHIIDEACKLASLDWRTNSMNITIEEKVLGLVIKADQIQIEQVILNLISNAADAMSNISDARLHISIGPAENQMVVVTVSDNGNGIDQAMADCLFTAFTTTKGAKGMGIGLSVCLRIIQDHGGKIWVEPGESAGATFCFTLPLA